MSQVTETPIKALSTFLNGENIKNKFYDIFQDKTKSESFIASALSLVNANSKLAACSRDTVYNALLVSASFDLPINPNFGYAFIIPYGDKAQFQIGYKGLVQLAHRSAQYLRIEVTEVYDGQIQSKNPLLGNIYDWESKKSETVIGYLSYFKLLNGFEKELYMSVEQIDKHANKYSETFKSKTSWIKEQSKWNTDFDLMAKKTVLKLLISKWGPLSLEMRNAIIADQAVIKNFDKMEVEYPDNKKPQASAESVEEELVQQWKELLNDQQTVEELETLRKQNKPTNKVILALFDARKAQLLKDKK